MTRDQLETALEQLVDAKGLREVIDALACVASLKGDHIDSNWQDRPLANQWRNAAKTLYAVCVKSAIHSL